MFIYIPGSVFGAGDATVKTGKVPTLIQFNVLLASVIVSKSVCDCVCLGMSICVFMCLSINITAFSACLCVCDFAICEIEASY